MGLTGVVLGHFRLLSRCGRSIPCTGSPNTPPPSCFSPFKSVPLSLNAYRALIDDLLGLSRIGRDELINEPLDLGKMVQEKAAELRNARPEREVEFMIADDAAAFGDERLIGVLVDNLVRNAWKFTSKHAAARIEFGQRQQDGETVFFIKDDGAGFDMEYADKLFLPF